MKIIKKILIVSLFFSVLYAQPQCEFPPQFGIKNFSFETHGYIPPEYALKDDTFGLVNLGKFGNDATRHAIENSKFPFEALNIIAGCGNSDAMYGASLVYYPQRVKEYWMKKANYQAKEVKSNSGSDNPLVIKWKKRAMIKEKRYREFAETYSKKAKEIQLYWLKRAMKLGNIMAIVKYYTDIEKNEEEFRNKIAKALYLIYNKNNNKVLRDIALSKLYYNEEYQKLLNIKLKRNSSKYYSLWNKALEKGYWKHFDDLYQVGIEKDVLDFFKTESDNGNSDATLKLVEYYSWRDYDKVIKYIELYQDQEFKLNEELYYYKNIYYKKNNNAYMLSKQYLVNDIWQKLDKYLELPYGNNIDNLIKDEDKKIGKAKKLNSKYKELSTNLFGVDLLTLKKFNKYKKLKLLGSSNKNISTKDESFIIDLMEKMDKLKQHKARFIKSNKRKTKKMKEMFYNLSNQSKNLIIEIAKELVDNNPKFYKAKAWRSWEKEHAIDGYVEHEFSVRVKSFILDLLEVMTSIENAEYNITMIEERLKRFNKKEYGLKTTKKVDFLALKIDTIVYSDNNSLDGQLINKYKLFKDNKSKIKDSIFHWARYIITNYKDRKNLSNAYYRLAKAYDPHLSQYGDYRLGNDYDKDKVFEYLNEIIKRHTKEAFSNYFYDNYRNRNINDYELFLKRAVEYSQKNKISFNSYFDYLRGKNFRNKESNLYSKYYNLGYHDKYNSNFTKELKELETKYIDKVYNSDEHTALSYVKRYLIAEAFGELKKAKEYKEQAILKKSFLLLSENIMLNAEDPLYIKYFDEDFESEFFLGEYELVTNTKQCIIWSSLTSSFDKLLK